MTKINIRENYRSGYKALQEEMGVKNYLALPKIISVTISTGIGKYRGQKERINEIKKSLSLITGQKASETISRKAISNFKIKKGDVVGLKVTLRNKRMYDFLDRLVNITLPRLRELKGIVEKNFDNQGNLNLGFKDTAPFAEITYDVLEQPFGLNITLTIAKSSKEKSIKLLSNLGFPIKNLDYRKSKE